MQMLARRVTRAAAGRLGRRCLSTGQRRNPFEIQFDTELTQEKPQISERQRQENAFAASVKQDIDLLHDELSNIFGSEMEEYDDSGSTATNDSEQSAEPESAIIQQAMTLKAPAAAPFESFSSASKPQADQTGSTDVLLVLGPCSFVSNRWISDRKQTREEVIGSVQSEAERLGLSVTTRDSNHEGTVLDLILNAQRPIVLCWNGRLSDSPTVVCALQAVAVPVILVSNSSSADHGPLPSCIQGVLSGFGSHSLSLALHAARLQL